MPTLPRNKTNKTTNPTMFKTVGGFLLGNFLLGVARITEDNVPPCYFDHHGSCSNNITATAAQAYRLFQGKGKKTKGCAGACQAAAVLHGWLCTAASRPLSTLDNPRQNPE